MLRSVIIPFLVLSFTISVFSQEREAVLAVTGEGEVRVQPDLATVQLGVVERHAQAQAAQEGANQTIGRVVAAVTELNVPREAIQTSRLRLHPIYSNQRQRELEEPRIVGYEANYMLSIRLESLDQVGPVVDAGLNSGANRLEGIHFGLKEELPFRGEALQAAVAQAGRKAALIAEAAGVNLGPILEISEQQVSFIPPSPVREMRMAEEAQAATPILPGEISIEAVVSVRYRIESR